MSYRQKNFNNHSAMSNKILYRGSINSSLINISKQLNNISINDINILKLKGEKNKLNSKNKNTNYSYREKTYSNNNLNRSFKCTRITYTNPFSSFDEIFDIKYSFCRAESFSILANKYIKSLNKNDLRKKNYILKENLKFLLNEIKKYKTNEKDNQIKEYENKIEYYINEIKKYKKDIIILKEKYEKLVIENKEMQKLIKFDSNNSRLNTYQGVHLINKTDLNKSITNRQIKNIKNLKSFKNINLNIKNYLNKNKKIIKDNYSSSTTKTSRNNKLNDINKINNNSNTNSNKYLYIDDKNTFQNSKDIKLLINENISNNSGFILNSKIIKKNNKIIINNKNIIQRIKDNKNNNDKNGINQVIFSRIEPIKKPSNTNRTLTKNKINQKSLKNTSFELNKSINLSQSFQYFKDKEFKKLGQKMLYPYKFNNYQNFNNKTFH